LAQFQIDNNLFTGTLPSFAACTKLINFFSVGTQFSGTLPSFATCTNLAQFQIHAGNQFSGTLPDFSACTKLTDFRCWGNQFSGTLPSFAACVDLEQIFIQNNSFSGSIPDFSACVKLRNFYINNNAFDGNLTVLKLPTNETGHIASVNSFTSFIDYITDLYTNRAQRANAVSINISGGSNATPGGTYQAPSGYVQATTGVNGVDGSPASEKEMIFVLVNQNIDNSTTKKYRFTITTK
jgi:hypothetical protein